jgi:hypothetical protein
MSCRRLFGFAAEGALVSFPPFFAPKLFAAIPFLHSQLCNYVAPSFPRLGKNSLFLNKKRKI